MPTTQLPPMCEVHRQLPAGQPVNLQAVLDSEWTRLGLTEQVRDKQIAIGVGSRGIAGIAILTRETVNLIQQGGGHPFIVPAMGCHGGGTADGQRQVLASLGITEDAIGCPIRATMETVALGETTKGFPVYIDRHAAEADGLMVINRVAVHPDFDAPTESGMLKMLSIGLGKARGAVLIHSHGIQAVRDYRAEIAAVVFDKLNFLAGIATVEDGYNQPVRVEMLPAPDIFDGDRRLLELARSYKPKLPVEDIDVLIVERMGKDISGTGMDCNVIGRRLVPGVPEPASPRIGAIVVLDLSDASHGNALGIGLADFTVSRLLEKIDFATLTTNVYTSGFLARGRIPLVFASEAEAIDAALGHVFRANPEDRPSARVVRIRDTRDIEVIWVTPNLLDEVKAAPGLIAAP